MKIRHFLPSLLAACCLASASVHATNVEWRLVNVTFGDGGTASGDFTYDADSNTFSNVNLVTTAGSVRSGGTYQFPDGAGSATIPDFIDLDFPVVDGSTARLDFFLSAAMTNAGGTIAFRQADEFTCLSGACTYATGTEAGLDLRRASGSITTVPEPSLLALLGAAGAALLLTQRRGRQARSSAK